MTGVQTCALPIYGLSVLQLQDLDTYHDIEGMMALIDACDWIVTASNVTAHMAGALGKTAVVLVPQGKGTIWYWHDSDTASLWYPSLRLIHQDFSGDWTQVMDQAHAWIERTQT